MKNLAMMSQNRQARRKLENKHVAREATMKREGGRRALGVGGEEGEGEEEEEVK